jgi:hypothetical protein
MESLINPRANNISLGKFLRLTLIGHTLFSLPVLIKLALFQLLSIDGALILIVVFSVIGIPLSTGITYLIAKGSSSGIELNDRRRSALTITAGVLLEQMYGVFWGMGCWDIILTIGSAGQLVRFYCSSLAGWLESGLVDIYPITAFDRF